MSITTYSKRAIVVFGKFPRPGYVKTRLSPPLSPEMACDLYRAFLLDVLDIVDHVVTTSDVLIRRYFVCAMSGDDIRHDVEQLLPPGWLLLDERGKNLGECINAACDDINADTIVVLGSDSPTMPPQRIIEAFATIEKETQPEAKPFVLGPTEDGGYYLVAMSRVRPALFANVIWSTTEVLNKTRHNALQAGIPLIELAEGYDIDRVTDFKRALDDAKKAGASRTAKAIQSALRILLPPC